jgi:hypothetical protein
MARLRFADRNSYFRGVVSKIPAPIGFVADLLRFLRNPDRSVTQLDGNARSAEVVPSAQLVAFWEAPSASRAPLGECSKLELRRDGYRPLLFWINDRLIRAPARFDVITELKRQGVTIK